MNIKQIVDEGASNEWLSLLWELSLIVAWTSFVAWLVGASLGEGFVFVISMTTGFVFGWCRALGWSWLHGRER